MKAVPTTFGDVSLKLEIAADGRTATVSVDPPRREAVDKLVVHLEHFGRPATNVSVAGSPSGGATVVIPTDRPATIKIELAAPNP